ncbi:MAG: SurA N-terminal domain-containing protein [Pseudomonadota bacterium]
MLNTMRRGAKGFLAKILIGLLVFAFAIWGISDFVNQIDPTEVAEAGNTPVAASEFARVYQRALGTTSQRLGRALSPQDAQAIGLPTQVLSQLVTEALQVDAAHKLGVDIGDEALAERIRTEPAFAAPNGSFDRVRFDMLLAENQYTEAEFIEFQRDAAAQEIFVNALLGGLSAPTAYLQAFNRFRNQTRTVEHFSLGENDIGPIPDPTETELRTYFEDNKSEFRAPEYRSVSVVTLSTEALADPDAVSADAVQRAYEVEGAYGSPERRRVQQVILDDKAVAERAAQALNNGTAFSAVLAEVGRTLADADLGLVQRSDLVDDAVGDAAFSLDLNGAEAVDGRFGPVLVRVSEIVAAGKRPFEEVEDEIRQSLALEEAQEQLRSLFNNVEDAVAGGARVAEIAERFSLPTRTVEAVDRQGNGPDGAPLSEPLPAAFVTAAFAADVGDDASPVEESRNSYSWVQLDGITEETDRPYEEVADAVLVAWTDAEKNKRVSALAEEAMEDLQGGQDMAAVAERFGKEVTTTEPFSHGTPTTELPQAVAAAAFEGPAGHVASVVAAGGDHVVLRVAEVSEPAFFEADADLQAARGTLNEGLADTLLVQFVNAYQAEVGATVNQPVLEQIIGIGEGLHRRM